MQELQIRASNGTLAHNAEKSPAKVNFDAGWMMEPKYDGWWIAAKIDADKVTLYARSGNVPPGRLPLVEAELLANFPADTWLVGEAVAIRYTADGHVINEWGAAQTALTTHGVSPLHKKVTFMVFDLLAHRGIDARTLGFEGRRKLLEKAFDGKGMTATQLSVCMPASKVTHKKLVAIGFEGSMFKRQDAPYAAGKRGHGAAKWKHEATEDVVVMGFEAGKDVGAVVFGQFKDGELVKRGTCKRKPDLIPTPDLMEWGGKVFELKHNGAMPSGALRHPSMERIRDDKAAKECVWA